jgi:hypothetical protein
MYGLLKLRIPGACKFCRASGNIALETTLTGGDVVLRWCCRSCVNEWPVTHREVTAAERRQAAADRRKAMRGRERRQL